MAHHHHPVTRTHQLARTAHTTTPQCTPGGSTKHAPGPTTYNNDGGAAPCPARTTSTGRAGYLRHTTSIITATLLTTLCITLAACTPPPNTSTTTAQEHTTTSTPPTTTPRPNYLPRPGTYNPQLPPYNPCTEIPEHEFNKLGYFHTGKDAMAGLREHTCGFIERDGDGSYFPHRAMVMSARPLSLSDLNPGSLYLRPAIGDMEIYALADGSDPYSCTVYFETIRGVVSFSRGDLFGPMPTEQQCVELQSIINHLWGTDGN